MASPIVICFYTLDTPYEQEVLNLITSCKKWGVELFVEGIKSRGAWETNCNHKPTFILEKLERFERPIFWADADSLFLQKPDFELFLPYDISVRKMEIFQNDPRFLFNTASFFANYNAQTIGFLKAWEKMCVASSTPFQDQLSLFTLLSQSSQPLRFFPMPVAYCKIYDIDRFFINDENVVLEQAQASRRYRNLLL